MLLINEEQIPELITDYMIGNMTAYSKQGLKVNCKSISPHSDWVNCINDFMSAIHRTVPFHSPLEPFLHVMLHKSNNTETLKISESREVLLSMLEETELTYGYLPTKKIHPELHIFSDQNAVNQFIRTKKLVASLSSNTKNVPPRILSAGNKGQFYLISLSSKDLLGDMQDKPHPVTSRFNPKYLEYMLDIDNPHICALLPYLLTAYVYNYKTNSFIERGKSGPRYAFFEEQVISSEAARVRKQLKKLGARFCLPEKIDSWKELFPSTSSDDNRKAWTSNIALAPWESLPVLWRVFVTWCAVFLLSTSDFVKANILPKIDFDASLKLFSSHTGYTPLDRLHEMPISNFLCEKYDSILELEY